MECKPITNSTVDLYSSSEDHKEIEVSGWEGGGGGSGRGRRGVSRGCLARVCRKGVVLKNENLKAQSYNDIIRIWC